MAEKRSMAQGSETRAAPPRPGPRPLLLHLTMATATWLNSRAALPLLKSGLLPWKPELQAAGESLRRDLEDVPLDELDAALDAVGRRRLGRLFAGVAAYRDHPYRRRVVDPGRAWQGGAARLLDYGTDGGRPVLAVPSLVNRAYILDLEEDRSLMRYLGARGLHPFLLDWGTPGEAEHGFTLTDYVRERLEPALDAVLARSGGPAILLGYCMGGLLTLALALRRRRDVAALALLAVPWDFHADNPAQAISAGLFAEALMPQIDRLGEMPVDLLQALFAGLDPFLAIRKFTAFAELDLDSARAREFVALEDWVNDGVPLSAPVARECLIGWYRDNAPARGVWRIAGEPVRPQDFDGPAFVVLPTRDRIVPPASAAALAAALPHAGTHNPPAGHIGMVVGSHAERQSWRPLADWLLACASGSRP